MGTDYNAYVGVIVDVSEATMEVPKQVWVNKAGKECKTQFSSYDGEKHTLATVMEKKSKDVYDVIAEAYDDEDWYWNHFQGGENVPGPKNFERLLCNSNRYGWSVDVKYGGDATIFDDLDVVKLVAEFEVEYSSFIELLKNNFETVEVKFALTAYYN